MKIKLEKTKELKPVTITFTPEEFEMLKTLFGQIGGDSEHPLGTMAKKIYDFGRLNGYTKYVEESSVPFVKGWGMHVPYLQAAS